MPALPGVGDFGASLPAARPARGRRRAVGADLAHAAAGAGLGLPIARGLARAHGGDLELVAHDGAGDGTGARFRLSLPRRAAPERRTVAGMDRLLVVGAGPVSDAIAPMAEVLGWQCEVVDDLDAARSALPGVSAVVVTSHHDGVDAPALAAALETPSVRYIGAMGSRRTQQRRRDWLSDNGVDEAAQAPIHGPAGLDIGADGPAEIALAVLAELVATMRGRAGAGSLQDRSGPIHPELGPGEAYCPTG